MPQRFSLKRVGNLMLALLACVGMAWFAPTVARAQNTNSGTITGQVVDAQGKAITGAVVMLTNVSTNGAQPTVTNSAGRYAFVNLSPGTYTLSVKKDGFKEAEVKNQTVALGQPLTVNVPMQVGTATQTVEVTATGAELQTMNATVGTTIGSDAILKLPALGRDANSLTVLQPNTLPGGGVSGAQDDENSYTLDGGSNTDDMDGNHADYTSPSGYIGGGTGDNPSGTMPTPAESVQTFTVGVNNQSADINSAAGSSVSMVTKRGTDAIHGSAYEYYLGSALGANSWENDATATPKAISHQNRFGASLGGEILPKWLGGKTYLFGNYEGRRYPNYATYEHVVPTASLRAGVVAANDPVNGWEYFNLNPTSVPTSVRQSNGTYGTETIAPATCTGYAVTSSNSGGTGLCDPEGLGLNPVTNAIWTSQMPTWNAPVANPGGDGGFNEADYISTINDSLKSNFFVARLDHDFGAKNHFTTTFHFYSLVPDYTGAQVDIGGALPGDTEGVPSTSNVRPNLPAMFTSQLTSSITPNTTNNFTYSYLRNFWQWAGGDFNPESVPGIGTLGGTMELSGETSNGLSPYNVNTQATRTRFWDGIGNTFNDQVSTIHGNHIFQFGGRYIHQRDLHQRNDNGGSIDTTTAYLTTGANIDNPYVPVGFTGPTSSSSSYANYYDAVLGIVGQSQTMYTRAGQDLTLQPQGTPLEEESEIPLYNAYFSDAWHLKPSLTLTYGGSYTVEMPPLEAEGRQVEAVDAAGDQISTGSYLAATERAALGGQTYNPEIGFATVGNIGSGLEYPYKPFYGGFSPRVAIAWNPNISGGWLGSLMGGNKTVIRGGWSRIYGRLNGVDLVLVPLLGTGLAQPIACESPLANGTCAGVDGATPATAFRIGPTSAGDNGLTVPLGAPPSTDLAQPYYPGEIQNGVVNPAGGSNDDLDPNFRPDRSDEFDLTIQRQFSPTFSTEIGYTGRILRNEYQSVDLDSVPYMLTVSGQQFQQAFAGMAEQMQSGSAISPEPFFETAMGGSSSAFCKGYSSCTAAVAAQYGPSGSDTLDPTYGYDVFALYSSLQQQSSWTLGRTTADAPVTCSTPGVGGCPPVSSSSSGATSSVVSASGELSALFMETSDGWGNYNALFWTVTMRNWHHLTAISNFTWSKDMGTGDVDQATSEYTVSDPFNLQAMYGPQYNNTPLVYNLYFIYEPGSRTQHGLMGHLLDGWSFAPIFTWNGGTTNDVNNGGDCDSFGEGNCDFEGTQETAIPLTGYTGGNSVTYGAVNSGIVGSNSNPANGGFGMNEFGNNAAAIYSEYRPIILGLDTDAQSGLIPGLHIWNVDFSVTKDLAISERFSAELNAQATNVFNHFSPTNPYLDINDPGDFGVIGGDAESPRAVEVGLAVRW